MIIDSVFFAPGRFPGLIHPRGVLVCDALEPEQALRLRHVLAGEDDPVNAVISMLGETQPRFCLVLPLGAGVRVLGQDGPAVTLSTSSGPRRLTAAGGWLDVTMLDTTAFAVDAGGPEAVWPVLDATVLLSSLRGSLAQSGAMSVPSAPEPLGAQAAATGVGGPVLTAWCVNDHPNPPHAPVCRRCAGAMSDRSGFASAPVPAALRFSTGAFIELSTDVLIGRAPRSVPTPGRSAPRLVTVKSPDQQISRSHCEVRVDGWDMRVRDLGTSNGTLLHRDGQEPIRLGAEGWSILRIGDTLDLGESITCTVEDV